MKVNIVCVILFHEYRTNVEKHTAYGPRNMKDVRKVYIIVQMIPNDSKGYFINKLTTLVML
jgi:hypothetical protein